jgi:RHS repeat-associated protein
LKYQFTGKEFNDDFGLGLNDYGARFYDAALGRWHSVDPLAEKTNSWSVYIYTANNPVKYIDPDGLTWKDPKEAEKLTKNIEAKKSDLGKEIAKQQGKLNNDKLSEEDRTKINGEITDLTARVQQLDKSLGDIKALGEDTEHTYDLVGSNSDEHHVEKDKSGIINIQGSSDALHIHEIRHVALSLASKAGLQFDNKGLLSATTIVGLRDEIEGYSAQYGYDPKTLPSPLGVGISSPSKISDINKGYIANIYGSNGYIYPLIRRHYQNEEKQKKLNKKNKE